MAGEVEVSARLGWPASFGGQTVHCITLLL